MSRSAASPRGTRPRGRLVVLAVGLAAAAAAGAPGAQAAAAPVAASQPLVVLLHSHVARTAPSVHARALVTVSAHRPLTGVRTVLPVLGEATSHDGRRWVRVLLPGRPNSRTGWIPTAWTRRTVTGWHLAVDLSARRLTVARDGRVVRRLNVVVGKPSTPTPRGRFFIEEGVALRAADPGSPFALATSARSNVLQEFDGGPGQIALHGTDHLSGAPGTAASHGCIRLSTRAIRWLAARVGRGVLLVVSR